MRECLYFMTTFAVLIAISLPIGIVALYLVIMALLSGGFSDANPFDN